METQNDQGCAGKKILGGGSVKQQKSPVGAKGGCKERGGKLAMTNIKNTTKQPKKKKKQNQKNTKTKTGKAGLCTGGPPIANHELTKAQYKKA